MWDFIVQCLSFMLGILIWGELKALVKHLRTRTSTHNGGLLECKCGQQDSITYGLQHSYNCPLYCVYPTTSTCNCSAHDITTPGASHANDCPMYD